MYVHHPFCHVSGHVLPSGEQGSRNRCFHALYFVVWCILYAVVPQVVQICNLCLMSVQYLLLFINIIFKMLNFSSLNWVVLINNSLKIVCYYLTRRSVLLKVGLQ